MKLLLLKLKCQILGHDWTCKAEQGIKPNDDERTAGIVGFHHYARTYCSKCGKLSARNVV